MTFTESRWFGLHWLNSICVNEPTLSTKVTLTLQLRVRKRFDQLRLNTVLPLSAFTDTEDLFQLAPVTFSTCRFQFARSLAASFQHVGCEITRPVRTRPPPLPPLNSQLNPY
jgi:hypothetical protein